MLDLFQHLIHEDHKLKNETLKRNKSNNIFMSDYGYSI